RGDHLQRVRGVDGEVLRRRHRDEGDHRCRADLRRLWLHARVPRRALHARRQDHADLRGHQPDPARGHRQGAARVTAARRLARFVAALTLDTIPEPVVGRAALLALDTLGNGLAAAGEDFGRSALDVVEGLGGAPESALLGRRARVAAANAVLANGSWPRRLRPGWVSHAGVVATLLARGGFTGPATVLEGEHGLYAAFAGGHDARRLEALLDTLGQTWELEALTLKPYPCGSIA